MSVGASRDDIEDVLRALRNGEGLDRLDDLRRRHGKARSDLLNMRWSQKTPEVLKQSLEDLLIENRIREEYFERGARAAAEDRHADRLAVLAAASNAIAEQANTNAAELTRTTRWLTGATVVLALATLALIWATLSN